MEKKDKKLTLKGAIENFKKKQDKRFLSFKNELKTYFDVKIGEKENKFNKSLVLLAEKSGKLIKEAKKRIELIKKQIITDHSQLDNNDWSKSGHVIDENLNLNKYKIVNLADGKKETDAVNVRTLLKVIRKEISKIIIPQAVSGGGITEFDAIVGVPGNYASITKAIDDGKKSIFIKKGTYSIGNLLIPDDCLIVGESKYEVILEVKPGQDGVKLYSSGSKIEHLTIDSETNDAEACLVIGDGQTAGSPDLTKGINNTINNVNIKGSNHTFALFVAGASYNAGFDTLTAYENSNLHSSNRIFNCTGTSDWDGDAFSFSLQNLGRISDNDFKGRIAFYMCRNSDCSNNNTYDSANQGLILSAPLNDNTIIGNRVNNANSSGIKINNQLEHTPLLAGQGAIGNIITNNTIVTPGNSGLEITGSENNPIMKNIIENNTTIKPGNHGIYLQDTVGNSIQNNLSDTPRSDSDTYSRGSGIYMVQRVKDNIINGNHVIDERDHICHTAIANREDTTCTGNTITNNKLKCKNQERTIWIQSDDNIVNNNEVEGGYYAGIRLDGANKCQVVGNKFKNNTDQANNAYYEVWLQNEADENFIADNYIESSASNKALAGIGIDLGCANNKIGINHYKDTNGKVVDDGENTIITEESKYIIKTTNYSVLNIDIEVNNAIYGNTDGGDISFTLPDSPKDKDEITFKNIGNSGYTLTLNRNGQKIDNQESDLPIADAVAVTLQFTSEGWLIIK